MDKTSLLERGSQGYDQSDQQRQESLERISNRQIRETDQQREATLETDKIGQLNSRGKAELPNNLYNYCTVTSIKSHKPTCGVRGGSPH